MSFRVLCITLIVVFGIRSKGKQGNTKTNESSDYLLLFVFFILYILLVNSLLFYLTLRCYTIALHFGFKVVLSFL